MVYRETVRQAQGQTLCSVYLVCDPRNGLDPLAERLQQSGILCQSGPDLAPLEAADRETFPQAALLDLASLGLDPVRRLIDQCRSFRLPVVVVVPRESANGYDPSMNPDDFILSPFDPEELTARVNQAVYRVNGPSGNQVLKVGELVIDLERYDVTMAGRRVALTYKEFQLLVLLASNPGRVYSREMLLSQVWGYDYLGGTRTVDVHVRRLRSKLEDPDHSFIETVWNVGYRFKILP